MDVNIEEITNLFCRSFKEEKQLPVHIGSSSIRCGGLKLGIPEQQIITNIVDPESYKRDTYVSFRDLLSDSCGRSFDLVYHRDKIGSCSVSVFANIGNKVLSALDVGVSNRQDFARVVLSTVVNLLRLIYNSYSEDEDIMGWYYKSWEKLMG